MRLEEPPARGDARPAGRAGAKRDPKHAFHDLVELLFASARSPRQRERLLRASGTALTGASLSALGLISRHAPVAVSDLATRLEIDLSTASRQVARLEKLGLVGRSADPSDRRVARLTITARGRRLLDRVREVSLNDFKVALGDWSAADRARFAALLDRFHDGLLRVQVDDTGWSVRKAVPRRPQAVATAPARTSPLRRRD